MYNVGEEVLIRSLPEGYYDGLYYSPNMRKRFGGKKHTIVEANVRRANRYYINNGNGCIFCAEMFIPSNKEKLVQAFVKKYIKKSEYISAMKLLEGEE